MVLQDLPRFEAGQDFSDQSARKLNYLVDQVAKISNITGAAGSGITVKSTSRGISIDAKIPEPAQQVGKTQARVIVRNIPDPDDFLLEVEFATQHPDFAGSSSAENRHRFIAASEVNAGNQPQLTTMAVWPHFKAEDYELFVWPLGDNPTTRATDILHAQFIDGGWWVRPDWRLYTAKLTHSARVGSCHAWGQLEALGLEP